MFGFPMIPPEAIDAMLRDMFAAAAMNGLIYAYGGKLPPDQSILPQLAYMIADAMMAARRGR